MKLSHAERMIAGIAILFFLALIVKFFEHFGLNGLYALIMLIAAYLVGCAFELVVNAWDEIYHD
jgi:Zn-dependent protease with chaperone function